MHPTHAGQDTHITKVLADIKVSRLIYQYLYIILYINAQVHMCVVPQCLCTWTRIHSRRNWVSSAPMWSVLNIGGKMIALGTDKHSMTISCVILVHCRYYTNITEQVYDDYYHSKHVTFPGFYLQ